ncbi:MAG: hypothetical protein L6Q57_02660 [Alphaproteobacteria bacterium]|nr:hypothetical protein [Alphaproteobacteria bacterium]
MPLTDIALCSRALIRIGAAPITAFDDESAEAEISGALYAPARDALLSSYPWSFASGQVALSLLPEAPLADYPYAFGLPSDFLRAISVGTGSKGRGLNYRIARSALHTFSDSAVLTYVFRPDESEFPPYFDQALIARLAAEFVIPVTENTSRAEALFALAEKEFQRARQIDAQQDSPNRIENFSLIDARG